MKIFALIITLCCFVATPTVYSEEITPEKKAAIKELMEVTGASKMGEVLGNAIKQQMMQVLKDAGLTIDPKITTILEEEAETMMQEELVVKDSLLPYMYPVYDKYLTLEEMNGLIQFYTTPLGKKAIKVMPDMTREAMRAGQEWGQKIVPQFQQKVFDRMEKEGIQLDK